MTKADIVREIATQTGLEKQVVLQVVEGFMDSVKSSMITARRFIFAASVLLSSNTVRKRQHAT